MKQIIVWLGLSCLLLACAGPPATPTFVNRAQTPVSTASVTVRPSRTAVVSPSLPSRTPVPTATAPTVSSTPTATPTALASASPSPSRPAATATVTPVPTEPAVGPAVHFFDVTPTEARLGDTVTLSWSARGQRATLCPTARYVLFTEADCLSVPLAGRTQLTIPAEAEGFQLVDFVLQVEGQSPAATARAQVSVALICEQVWFFSGNRPRPAGICPREPIRSAAAAQRFEHGSMIWVEALGRYFILHEEPLYDGGGRKRLDVINDPLQITGDTSAQVGSPPEGLYAPHSGFGLVWRGDVAASPGYRQALGWALAPETGYQTIYQCDDARPSGGRSWQTCYLQGPAEQVIVLHALGGWYRLGPATGDW